MVKNKIYKDTHKSNKKIKIKDSNIKLETMYLIMVNWTLLSSIFLKINYFL